MRKKSLYRFLALYLASVSILLAVIGYLFFQNSANMMRSAMRFEMLYQSRMIESKLLMAKESGKKNISKELLLKIHPVRFKVAFFDKSKKPLFSQIDKVPMFNKIFYAENNHCYSVVKFPEKGVNVGYIVLREDELKLKIHKLKQKVILYLVGLFIFMAIVGYFLSKLFLKPIRERIESIDNFIEDTTHELNTPISAILMTIQTLKGVESKKLERLKASAKRLSTMYDSLSYMLQKDEQQLRKEHFNLARLIAERVEANRPLANNKQISIKSSLQVVTVLAEPEDIRRIIDNVLSNAIKYSNPNSKIEVVLEGTTFSVQDYGIGISKYEQSNIFKRYQRHNKDRGGFGIGLSIVLKIAKANGIKISIESQKGEGAKFIFDISKIVS